MRKIVQFQSTTAYVYALTDDGILWRKTHKGDAWDAIRGPGDQNPFKHKETLQEAAERMPRGFALPAKGRHSDDIDDDI